MSRVALATYAAAPDLAPDDQLLRDALERTGIQAEAAVWSDVSVDWALFDAVVIRSCWDYHLRYTEFRNWLDRLDAIGRRVWNPTSIVRWNSDKHYLVDLADGGVATVPTRIVSGGPGDGIDEVVDVATAEGWPRFVVKPTVSASGYETHALVLPLDADARAAIRRVTSLGETIVQPFIDEVSADGELSLVFFDGVFSHAAIKRARHGEFRVQTEHGGTAAPIDVVPALVEAAAKVLRSLGETPLYARVDGVGDDRSFRLMELELIEPHVFLGSAPGSADRFARAIAERLG